MSIWLPLSTNAARSSSRRLLISSHTTHRVLLGPLLHRRHESSKPASSSQAPSRAAASPPADPKLSKPAPPATKEPPKGPLVPRVWKKVKHEAQHYWHGSKLLVSEVRISGRLQWKILQGDALTRREKRQVSSKCSFTKTIPFTCHSNVAQTNDHRLASSCAIRSFHYYSLHGTFTTCRTEAIPKYASFHFRGQICRCTSILGLNARCSIFMTKPRRKRNSVNFYVFGSTWQSSFKRHYVNQV